MNWREIMGTISIFNIEEFYNILLYICNQHQIFYIEQGGDKIIFFDLDDDNDFILSFKFDSNLFCYNYDCYYNFDIKIQDNNYIDFLLDIDNIIKKIK